MIDNLRRRMQYPWVVSHLLASGRLPVIPTSLRSARLPSSRSARLPSLRSAKLRSHGIKANIALSLKRLPALGRRVQRYELFVIRTILSLHFLLNQRNGNSHYCRKSFSLNRIYSSSHCSSSCRPSPWLSSHLPRARQAKEKKRLDCAVAWPTRMKRFGCFFDEAQR